MDATEKEGNNKVLLRMVKGRKVCMSIAEKAILSQ